MRTYLVRFWHYTDLRCEWRCSAYNETAALLKALEIMNTGQSWCDGPGFCVEIISD